MKHKKDYILIWKRILLIAAIALFSLSTLPLQKTDAAPILTLKGNGASSVQISDYECTATTKNSNLIKIKPKVTGYVTFRFLNNCQSINAYGFATFCNSKKKALGTKKEFYQTGSTYPYVFERTYPVKKGSTYYLKLESTGGVKVSATVKAVKKNAGTKKSKAKTLSRNKTRKGIILAGSRTVDWYKIRLTKKKKIFLTCTAKTNGVTSQIHNNRIYYFGNKTGLKVTFCDKNGKDWSVSSKLMLSPSQAKNSTVFQGLDRSTGKTYGLSPGTYYIKVERMNKASSGYYTLKWNFK